MALGGPHTLGKSVLESNLEEAVSVWQSSSDCNSFKWTAPTFEFNCFMEMMTSLQHVNPTVRGLRDSPQTMLQNLAERIRKEISLGAQKPFKKVIDVSSGDPHRVDLQHVSFLRQVLAVCIYPQLLEDKCFPLDVKIRAQKLLEACDGASVGSYTASSGLRHVRQSIAEFITKRDGVPSYAQNIFISAGSQRAIMIAVKLLASGEGNTRTGVLIPGPCPHMLYNVLEEAGVVLVPYQLTEERGWAVDLDNMHQALKAARGYCEPRAIYISNPGNPTGHVQDRKSIEEVIQFAAAERVLLLADEVYQDSVYGKDREFISYKKVLFEMDIELAETVQLISFHSLSSTCIRECGLRAGYMEVVNMDPEVIYYFDNTLCGDISTPVTGQLGLDLMVNPPQPGDPSYHTYMQETFFILATLSHNAQWVQELLNKLPGVRCQPVLGGIYVFPRLHLPCGIKEQAKLLGLKADVLYCQKLLEEEGVLAGAGEHGEMTDSFHLRLCILVPHYTLVEVLARLTSFHCRLMGGTVTPTEV
ncbi:alanine aminotransferase 1 [Haplochromis burtoni]|nr:alanine aminotransferase 1 [Haplochromis burtoni]